MTRENHQMDRKSLRKISGPTANFGDVAADCVCFANASGGVLLIGFEDGFDEPPQGQRIAPELLDTLRKRVGELTVNVQVAPIVRQAPNGAEYIELAVARAVGVASTSDGRYFMRVADACKPVLGDDVLALLNDRPLVAWETMRSVGESVTQADASKVAALSRELRASERVKASVKEKTDAELLQHYGLADGDRLTHLGVLVVGSAAARARLGSAPVVQAIKYDEAGQKIGKWLWADYALSPVELPDAIWRELPDFHESYELPDGLHRQQLPAYDRSVVRELLVNALVHRPYTQRGDIFLNLHPDRMEVVNPGRLPFGGVGADAAACQPAPQPAAGDAVSRLAVDGAGGFGLRPDVCRAAPQGRTVPLPRELDDAFSVTVGRRVVKPEVLSLMSEVDARHQPNQRERITLGMLAASEGLTARELTARLELVNTDELASWLGRLLEFGVVQASGRTQGKRYFVAPGLLRTSGLRPRTTLRRIEPHRLGALVEEDLRRYPGSSSGEVNERVGKEVPYSTLKRCIDDLVKAGAVRHEGQGRWRRYWLTS